MKVDAPQNEKKRRAFIDFKRRVYHTAWSLMLAGMRRILSLGGLALKCGDGIVRVLVPGVYILSHDFEEQYV